MDIVTKSNDIWFTYVAFTHFNQFKQRKVTYNKGGTKKGLLYQFWNARPVPSLKCATEEKKRKVNKNF